MKTTTLIKTNMAFIRRNDNMPINKRKNLTENITMMKPYNSLPTLFNLMRLLHKLTGAYIPPPGVRIYAPVN